MFRVMNDPDYIQVLPPFIVIVTAEIDLINAICELIIFIIHFFLLFTIFILNRMWQKSRISSTTLETRMS